MSRDPYLDVKREVEANLNSTRTLLASYNQLASESASTSSPALVEALEELKGTLGLLEVDLEDLEESVRVVEQTGDRWGIDGLEVRRRRTFVQRVQGEVKILQDIVYAHAKHPSANQPYRDEPDLERNDDAVEAERWEREEQQVLISRQDDTLGVISGTLSTLASQAGLIGQEVGHQSEMLDDLSTRVDSTSSRLRKVQRTMQDFIRRNEETRSSWCIGILVVILMILLLAVILV